MFSNWSLKYLILGNLWYLVHNREILINQPNMTVICYQNAELLCTLQVKQELWCTNVSMCRTSKQGYSDEGHNNKSKEENSSKEVHCDIWFTSCTVMGSGVHECLLEDASEMHKNITVNIKTAGCSEQHESAKEMNHNAEFLFYFFIFMSLLLMILSNLCSRNINDSSTDSHHLAQKLLLKFKAHKQVKTEVV